MRVLIQLLLCGASKRSRELLRPYEITWLAVTLGILHIPLLYVDKLVATTFSVWLGVLLLLLDLCFSLVVLASILVVASDAFVGRLLCRMAHTQVNRLVSLRVVALGVAALAVPMATVVVFGPGLLANPDKGLIRADGIRKGLYVAADALPFLSLPTALWVRLGGSFSVVQRPQR